MEIFTRDSQKFFLKEQFQKSEGEFAAIANELQFEAERRLTGRLYSVTFSKSLAASGDPHDYYSEAPYWWPNSEDPNGPFIRRDGEFYPGRLVQHRIDMTAMAKSVYILSTAGFLFDRTDYLKRAAKLLDVWFLNEDSKMNPHLEYAQAIHNVCEGRGIGIIDTTKLLPVIEALDYLTLFDFCGDTVSGMRDWFSAYNRWLTTSEKGLFEKNHPNNHSNWWGVQVAAFAAFCDKKDLLKECFTHFKHTILPQQTGANGEFMDELTRTNSMSYCMFNLEASALIAEIAFHFGEDLWHYKTEDGRGLIKCLSFMYPFYNNPFLWKHSQIDGRTIINSLAFQLASVRVDEAYGQAESKRRKGLRYFANTDTVGALCLTEGFSASPAGIGF